MTDRALLSELEALERERARRQGATDPILFARSVGVTTDAWQSKVLQSRARRLLLCCSRQAGKSTVAALAALHRALYQPKSLILIIAPSWRQSAEVLRKVQDFLARLPVPAHLDSDSKTEIELRNGSRIVSLPAGEAKIRGFSAVSLLIMDEAGDIPDELYHAVLPMLIISRGSLLVMGTPKGPRGFFWESWENGGPGWDRVEAPWQECPRIDPEDIKAQRIALKEKFSQEFECKFIRLSGGMVYSAFDRKTCCVQALPDSKSWQYLLGIDFGFVDATAFVVVGWRPHDPTLYAILSFQESGLHVDDIAKRIHELSATYRFTRLIGDVSGYGKGPAEELRSRYRLNIEPAPKQDKAGYVDLLNGGFATGGVKVLEGSCSALIDQLIALPWNDTRTNQADGYDDHMCDGLLYAYRVATTYLAQPAAKKPGSRNEEIQQWTRSMWDKIEGEQARAASGDWVDDGGELNGGFDD